MKAYLTLLRRDGTRLTIPPSQMGRLVSLTMRKAKGFRQARATCCYGGDLVSVLWEPIILGFGNTDFVLTGFERVGDAAVAQEWRLRPHG